MASFSPAKLDAPKANVLGVGVHAISMKIAVDAVLRAIDQNRRGFICVTGVHGVMEAQDDPAFKQILNNAFVNCPDGMPTVWMGKLQGNCGMERVYGPDFMLQVCAAGIEPGLRHFFYGGKEGVAEQLKSSLEARFPGLNVVGTYTPPFRPLNATEVDELKRLTEEKRPDIIWVGLSTPKQERFMTEFCEKLNAKVMVGVGAAFDIHTGSVKEPPEWVKNSGLQWLHRLIQEPRRLWRRYLYNNPRFLWMAALQTVGLKKF